MGVNLYDNPAEAQFINTYTRLPFREIAAMGEILQKKQAAGEAATDQASALVDQVQALESPYDDISFEDKTRRDERIKYWKDQISGLTPQYKENTGKAKREADRIARGIKEDMSTGVLSEVQSRYTQHAANVKEAKEARKAKGRELLPLELRKLYEGIEQFQDPTTGDYGSVGSYSTYDYQSFDDMRTEGQKIVNNVSANTVLNSNLKGILPDKYKNMSMQEILQLDERWEILDEEKLRNALLGQVGGNANFMRSSMDRGQLYGRDGEYIKQREVEVDEVGADGKKTGKKVKANEAYFDVSTPEGMMMEGLIAGKKYKKNLGKTYKTLNNKLAADAYEKDKRNELVDMSSGQARTVEGQTFEGHYNKVTQLNESIKTLEQAIAAGDPNSMDYKDNVNRLERYKAQRAAHTSVLGKFEDDIEKWYMNPNNVDAENGQQNWQLNDLRKVQKAFNETYEGNFWEMLSNGSWRQGASHIRNDMPETLAKKLGMDVDNVEDVLRQAAEAKGALWETASSDDRYITPIEFTEHSGDVKSGDITAGVVKKVSDNVTNSYIDTNGYDWLLWDPSNPDMPAEAYVNDLAEDSPNAKGYRKLFPTNMTAEDGSKVFAMHLYKKVGMGSKAKMVPNEVSNGSNVVYVSSALATHKNEANAIDSQLEKSKEPSVRKEAMISKAMGKYASQIGYIPLPSLKEGDPVQLGTLKAPTGNSIGIQEGEQLYVVREEGVNKDTNEYSIVDADGNLYINGVGTMNDIYFNLRKYEIQGGIQ